MDHFMEQPLQEAVIKLPPKIWGTMLLQILTFRANSSAGMAYLLNQSCIYFTQSAKGALASQGCQCSCVRVFPRFWEAV